MQYTATRQPKGKVEIKVDVPKAAFEESYKGALDSLSKSTNIAGFRPGMAPADVVEKHVGISKVLNEAASTLINKHLSEIFEKEKFFPIDSPKIAIESLAQSAPLSFVVSFTQKPEVKIGDWKKIRIKKLPVKEIGEAEVMDSIKNIYEAWKKQKAAKGEIEQKGEEDGGKYIYDAQGNKIPIKDEKGAENKKVEAAIIDDEFARTIGAKDLAHLKELVKHDLETIVTDQVEMKLEEELFDEILKVIEIEVPELLIEDELNRILLRLTSQLEQQGKELDDYLKEQNTTIDELKNKWRVQAEKNVKSTLVMDEIGRAEQIKVSQEEIQNTMKGINQTATSPEQKQDMERYVALSIFQAKTLDLVKKTITAETSPSKPQA